MIISVEEYYEILKHCKGLVESFQLPDLTLCDRLNVEYDSLVSICSQLHVKQTKKLLPLIEQNLERIAQVKLYCLYLFIHCICRELKRGNCFFILQKRKSFHRIN